LAPVTDPASLELHIAAALGLWVEGSGSVERALLAALRDCPPLLVLDNCEHLVEACARLVETLLQACPTLRVLATSREALGIGGERSWLVPPLSLATEQAVFTPAETGKAEAVRLFVERAREVMPEFELTSANAASLAHICRRLDGLPLAIELAAARVNVLPPEQLAERLDDRFTLLNSRSRSRLPRHRTLRAAVDWSYELLSDGERVLLERLAVFAGGFTLGAAEQVCAADPIAESEVLDLLASLTTRSLVTMQEEHGRARYRLLETIREYAAERASKRAGSIDTFERHARYFLGLARALEPDLIAAEQLRIQQVDTEYENIRTALGWSASVRHGTQCGLPLAWALMWYWYHRQLWHEGFRQFGTALETAVAPDPECRAAALMGLGLFGLFIGEGRDLCRDRLRESEQIWRAAGNLLWLSFTLVCRSIEARLRGEIAQARCLAEEAMSAASAEDEAWAVAVASIHALVPALIGQEAWPEARRVLVDGERAARDREDNVGLAYVLDTRAYVEMQLGNHAEAESLA
ncbi:MAG TPA: hypothetical protein VLT59_07110, partial [Steroidobacteraceae bacterium]|nr:hypothetical protein [Steroidobacteraceae bacterium]